MKLRLAVMMVALAGAQVVGAVDYMKAFPAAEAGETRYVLQLPKLENEAGCKVELQVGKVELLDAANHYFIGGKIEAEPVSGWGFTRYVVRELGPLVGTKMGVDPNAPEVERFITLGGPTYLIPYNSGVPLVVYVPQGAEVRYRIWHAGAELKMMEAK